MTDPITVTATDPLTGDVVTYQLADRRRLDANPGLADVIGTGLVRLLHEIRQLDGVVLEWVRS